MQVPKFRWLIAWLALASLPLATPCSAQVTQDIKKSSSDNISEAIDDAKAAMLIDPNSAIKKSILIERLAVHEPKSTKQMLDIATAQWLRGEAYVRLGDPAAAIPLIDNAQKIVGRLPQSSVLTGELLLSQGRIHLATADVGRALADYQSAHNIFRRLGDSRNQAIALLSIASLYQDAQNYEPALKYYRQAFDVYQADPKLLLSIYNNRATTLKELGRIDESQTQLREALKLARQLGSPVYEAQILRNLARGELAAGNLSGAEKMGAEAMALSRRLDGGSMAQAWSVAAQLELQRGNLSLAAHYIAKAFAGADITKTPLFYIEAHRTAYEVYRRLGNSTQALAHLASIKRLDDETSKLAASANNSLMAAQFDFANQDLKIARLRRAEAQRSLELERSRAQFQRTIFSGVVLATLFVVSLLIIGLLTIQRSRNEVREANIDLASTNRALEKALAAKTEFLATTSHEIRTPLNGILGMTQVMLADPNLPAGARDRVSVVHGAGVTMRALVDDILDVAKMETGNLTLEQAPFDLKATLSEVSRLWQEQAVAKGLAFNLDLVDCPVMVEGDAARLRQIVFNLLSNALKFTATGSVTLLAAAPEPGTLSLSVQDTGIGIPADKLEIIFESFRQVDAGTTRKFGGTGLGLSICRNLAQAMGGDVRVDSVEGQGSTFTVTVPLTLAEPSMQAVELNAASEGLLIVDRNPITRSMLKALLEPRAGTVTMAGSIEDAVTAMASNHVAKVLIDESVVRAVGIESPAIAGLVTAAKDQNAPVVLLWANAESEDKSAFSTWRIDTVIFKPISGAALAEMLYPDAGANVADGGNRHIVSNAA
ncbi:MAG: tetratricopeptide repeat protein [Sphingomonas sp.]|nr:tetratricopeptide repeat protein [Sphingomonas sp.]